MSTRRFPQRPESNHPQYLWNEQEYIIRMLTQNRIGVSLEETTEHIIISLQPDISMNVLAHGPTDFLKNNNARSIFLTDNLKWIYFRQTDLSFYEDRLNIPNYNPFLHGWYHPVNNDRAVAFIDPELARGIRCTLMDTPNAMNEWNSRISLTDGQEVFYKNSGGAFQWLLEPGRYRFEVRGGRGGNGGAAGMPLNATDEQRHERGGLGAMAPLSIHRITLLSELMVTGYVGFNGNHGENGRISVFNLSGVDYTIASSGAGGASGEDSFVHIAGILLTESIGGAGAGGSGLDNYTGIRIDEIRERRAAYISSGPGGGGAGSGTAQDGTIFPAVFPDLGVGLSIPARRGTLNNGGDGALENEFPRNWQLPGQAGENRRTTNQTGQVRINRNGGDSLGFTFEWEKVEGAIGGRSVMSDTNGYVRIVKTGMVAA